MKSRFFCSVSALPILFAGPAIAADMPLKAPAPPVSVFSWTGFYAGPNAGGSWGHAQSDFAISGFASTVAVSDSVNPDGVVGGGQLGYNWQLDPNWLIGVEADIQASGEKASGRRFDTVDIEGVTTNYETRIDWFGTVRGRLGYSFDRRILFYATGGLAYGHISISGTSNDVFRAATTTTAFSNANTNTGWTVGGGIEGVAWSPRWTWKVEYLYLDFGTLSNTVVSAGVTTTTAKTRFTDNVVRAGLNFHF
jgi:outer membrane immunogenic protein